MPAAYFPNTQCNIASYFGPASIIIDIDLCEWVRAISSINLPTGRGYLGGDWAGNNGIYAASGCPGTCVGRLSPGMVLGSLL